MAGREPSISRRRILGAAAALPLLTLGGQLPAKDRGQLPATVPLSRRLWARRLARYRRLADRAQVAAESGWFRAANERYDRESAEIAARFGGWEGAGASEQGRRVRAAAFGRVARAEEAFWERCTAPMQRAAVALALTAAPDLAALRDKIAAMRAHELETLDSMPRHPLDLVDEDLARLMEARES